jgi:hypothetical protein
MVLGLHGLHDVQVTCFSILESGGPDGGKEIETVMLPCRNEIRSETGQ